MSKIWYLFAYSQFAYSRFAYFWPKSSVLPTEAKLPKVGNKNAHASIANATKRVQKIRPRIPALGCWINE